MAHGTEEVGPSAEVIREANDRRLANKVGVKAFQARTTYEIGHRDQEQSYMSNNRMYQTLEPGRHKSPKKWQDQQRQRNAVAVY